jgi:hypothetical protein
LTRALVRAGIPVFGVSIGDPSDRATWHIDYDYQATPEQRTAGDALMATYDLEADTVVLDEIAVASFDTDRKLKALAIATANALGIPPATFRAAVIAAYKALPQ